MLLRAWGRVTERPRASIRLALLLSADTGTAINLGHMHQLDRRASVLRSLTSWVDLPHSEAPSIPRTYGRSAAASAGSC